MIERSWICILHGAGLFSLTQSLSGQWSILKQVPQGGSTLMIIHLKWTRLAVLSTQLDQKSLNHTHTFEPLAMIQSAQNSK